MNIHIITSIIISIIIILNLIHLIIILLVRLCFIHKINLPVNYLLRYEIYFLFWMVLKLFDPPP